MTGSMPTHLGHGANGNVDPMIDEKTGEIIAVKKLILHHN